MKRVNKPSQVRRVVMEARNEGRKISLVPTMGALHEGHESLIKLASENSDFLVVSIFVNPKQFGPGEDFSSYPRDIERDGKIAGELGCDLLFTPEERDIYSYRDLTRIKVKHLSSHLCGVSRPGHFDGVVLVVAKLFNIVQPDVAVFGQKDAQQAVIIQRMTYDLDFPVMIKLGPTVREKDGLAVSSRNSYLTANERKRASALYRALNESRMKIEDGNREAEELCTEIRMKMERVGFDVHYAEMVEGETLRRWDGENGVVLIAAAGKLGNTRLIDNIALRIDDEKVEEALLEFQQWSRYEE
jgi:pantoate--beta-alanine ligase